MARRRTPQKWQVIMDRAGLSSIRRLSEAAGVSHNALTRAIHGDSIPEPETVSALASALSVPESTIYKLTHGRDISLRPWEPPSEVQRLTKREQDALTEMIRAMASAREQEEVGDHGSSAPNTGAAGTAAEEDEKVTPLPHRSREYRPPWEERDAAFEPGEYEEGIDPEQI